MPLKKKKKKAHSSRYDIETIREIEKEVYNFLQIAIKFDKKGRYFDTNILQISSEKKGSSNFEDKMS